MTALNKNKIMTVPNMTRMAILTAAACLLDLIPGIPMFGSIYKLDFSLLPVLLGTFSMGPVEGVIILLLKCLIGWAHSTTMGIGKLAEFLMGLMLVVPAGMIYRANPTDCDVCVLYYDGTMKVMSGDSFDLEEAIEDGAWQAWTFGPALLDTGGQPIASFSSTKRIISANPRTAIGYYEPGHYCLVVVDGRGESAGISLPRLSQLFYDLGCTAAYNLDGGNSSIMVGGDEVINNPSGGGRESSDALLIAEVRDYE